MTIDSCRTCVGSNTSQSQHTFTRVMCAGGNGGGIPSTGSSNSSVLYYIRPNKVAVGGMESLDRFSRFPAGGSGVYMNGMVTQSDVVSLLKRLSAW